MALIDADCGPILTVTLDFDSGVKPVPVEGILFAKIDDNGDRVTYRVTAPILRLVMWVANIYCGITFTDAEEVAYCFLNSEFAKVTRAFGL